MTKIAIIGLGYVGLSLAKLLSTKYQTIGFDVDPVRVKTLMDGYGHTLAVSDELLKSHWKSRARLTLEGKVALTSENLLFLSPL